MTGGVAIFDFDQTLIRQGSLVIFLSILAGRFGFLSAGAAAAVQTILPFHTQQSEGLRAGLLRRTLAGRSLAEIEAAAVATFSRLDWNPKMMEAYNNHRGHGHRIVIATGGLSCYMPTLLRLKGLHTDGLLASDMVIDGDIMTGRMAGPPCTWQEKARRVSLWLGETKDEIWGYGNMPNDGAMLALVHHPHVVS